MPRQGPIHYRFDGPDDAPVLVLAHSLGIHHGLWDPQVPTLGARFRLLRYDSRGHGQSEVTPGPYTIERFGRDVVDLLDGLGIERAHFCGLSIGGAVGIWLALSAPGRLRRLVLANTAARIGTAEIWAARIDAVRAGGVAAVAPFSVERWFTPAFRERAPDAVDRARQMLLATPTEGYLAACAAVRDMDAREQVARITVPTLVLSGTHDATTPPADGHFLAGRIPGARYLELPAAHLSNIEAANWFGAAVTEFLEA
jgi:3-oxoadipate enol-lactonase